MPMKVSRIKNKNLITSILSFRDCTSYQPVHSYWPFGVMYCFHTVSHLRLYVISTDTQLYRPVHIYWPFGVTYCFHTVPYLRLYIISTGTQLLTFRSNLLLPHCATSETVRHIARYTVISTGTQLLNFRSNVLLPHCATSETARHIDRYTVTELSE